MAAHAQDIVLDVGGPITEGRLQIDCRRLDAGAETGNAHVGLRFQPGGGPPVHFGASPSDVRVMFQARRSSCLGECGTLLQFRGLVPFPAVRGEAFHQYGEGMTCTHSISPPVPPDVRHLSDQPPARFDIGRGRRCDLQGEDEGNVCRQPDPCDPDRFGVGNPGGAIGVAGSLRSSPV